MAEVSENVTWPFALARSAKENYIGGFGYPDGLSARALAPSEVRHMVHEQFDKFPPADPRVHYFLGLLYVFLGFASGVGNYYVLKIFTKYKQLRSPSNMLVINLAFCDFMLFIGLYPELVINSFGNNGIWIFGEIACLAHAWVGTTFGFAQMVTLSLIAYDRFHVIVRGMSGAPPSYKRSMNMLIYIWSVSLFWGSAPLFGLGQFRLDGILSSCSYDYLTPSANIYTYIGGGWFFGFLLPLATIIFCYFHIVKAVCDHEESLREQAKKMNVKSLRSGDQNQAMSAEIKVAKVAMLNIILWLFAWTPFAVLSFVGLRDPMRITPLMSSIPVIIAKSSSVYNPIIYALSHPKYQECLRQEIGWVFGSIPKSKNGDNASMVTAETVSNDESA